MIFTYKNCCRRWGARRKQQHGSIGAEERRTPRVLVSIPGTDKGRKRERDGKDGADTEEGAARDYGDREGIRAQVRSFIDMYILKYMSVHSNGLI